MQSKSKKKQVIESIIALIIVVPFILIALFLAVFSLTDF